MELYAGDLFFRGDNEEEKILDYCIHGKVTLKIGDQFLSDETEWCVSASGFRFLQTLFENHFMGAEQFLIPCCGHTMIPSDDGKTVQIYGCSNGIDFNIIHEEENILMITEDHTEYRIPFEDYKTAVISFAKQVMDFYQANPPRKFEDEYERAGFGAFVTQWHTLYDRAIALEGHVSVPPITFEDYDAITENEILSICETGITLKSFRFINFEECAYHFKKTMGGSGKCIGEREIEDLSFTFYTSPKPIMIIFIKKNKLTELLSKRNAASRFQKLQKQIIKYGYSTLDVS